MGGNGSDAGQRVHIGLLGPLTVTVGGALTTEFGRTQQRLIVALALAAADGARMNIGVLADTVYGAARPPRPRRSLATLVWRLRRDWGPETIESDRYHYWLNPDRCSLDITEFENALDDGRQAMAQVHAGSGAGGAADAGGAAGASPGTAGAIRALERALSWWRSDAADIAVPSPHRERLIELRVGATERLAALLAAEGRHQAAIDLLTPIVTEHPDWEHSAALLVESQSAIGDADGARRTFDIVRRALLAQGVEPGPELIAAQAGGEPIDHWAGSTRPVNAVSNDDSGALVGRRRERDLLVGSILVALDSRRPAAVLVSGEAGIGKTTLVQASVIDVHTHRRTRIVTVYCDRRSTLPFAPLQALADAAPQGALARLSGIATGSEPIDDAADVHAAMLQDVRQMAHPDGLILVVEDAQFASRETAVALTHLLQRCGAIPLAVVATTRTPHRAGDNAADDTAVSDPAVRPGGPTDDGSATFASLADRHLRLTGLSMSEVAQMAQVEGSSTWAARLHHLTGGNPLFVRQVQHVMTAPDQSPDSVASAPAARRSLMTSNQVEHLLADLPTDLAAAIEAHLSQVPSATRAALRTAAAVGDHFDLMTLAALSGDLRRSFTEWQDHVSIAVRHGLVRPDGDQGQFRFTHALIAAHLYGQLTPNVTAMTHAAIATALQRISVAQRCPADLLAHHYALGWPQVPTHEVVHAHLRAAAAVGTQLDFTRAADYYRTALKFLALDPNAAAVQRTAEILGAAAGASAAAGDIDGALDHYRSQERLATESGLTRSRIFAALGALRIAFLRRSHPQVADPLAEALDASVHDEDLTDYLDLAGDALGAVSVYRPARARELLDAFASRGPAITTPLRIAVWEHQQVPDQLATARTLADVATSPAEQISAWLRLWVSEVSAGLRRFDDPPPRGFHLGDADEQTVFDLAQWRITRHITAGRFARARMLINEALAAPPHPDPAERARRAVSFYGQGLFLAMLTGEEHSVANSPVAANPTWMTRHPVMRYIRAFLMMRGGGQLQARVMVDELIDELSDGDIPECDIGPRLILTTEICRMLDHSHGLSVCLPGLEKHRGEHGIFRFGQYWGSIDHSLADSRMALGDIEGAVEVFRDAITGLERIGATVHLPPAHRALAQALEHLGPRDHADEIRALRLQADATDRDLGLSRGTDATVAPSRETFVQRSSPLHARIDVRNIADVLETIDGPDAP